MKELKTLSNKRKPKSKPKLIDECATLLQKLVRLKAADHQGFVKCVSCGAVKRWQEMQGGHYIERRRIFTKLKEENIHPQCAYCNIFGMSNSAHCRENYRTYGLDFHKELLEDSLKVKKYGLPEVRDMLADLKKRVKEQEDQLGSMMPTQEDEY
mgnify:CR=1 FL=1